MRSGTDGPGVRSPRVWLALAAAGLLAWGCSDAPLPPLPEPSYEGLATPVRAQLREAWSKAAAQPTNPLAVGDLGRTLYAYGSLQAAAACFARCRILDPGAFRWAYLLGVTRADLGESAAARQAFAEASSIRPSDLPTAIRLADLLEREGDAGGARDILQSALREAPGSAAVRYRLGRLLVLLETDVAMEHLEAALDIEPDYREAIYALAGAYRLQGEHDASARLLEQYEKADPAPRRHYADPIVDSLASIRAGSAQVVFNEGFALQARGDLDGARQAYATVLEIDPNYVQGHVNLVSIFGDLGDHERAALHYRRAVELDPAIAEAHYNYGVSRHLSGDYAGAVESFRKALAINDQNADTHGNLATSLEEFGRPAEAETHYRAALQHNPAHPMANFHLGRRLAERGRYAEAVPYLQRAVAAESPGTSLHAYLLALVHRQLGQSERAREAARLALRHARARGQAELEAKILAELPR